MRILGVIPARMESTRYPGKPLVSIGGTSMIMRVYNQAKKCNTLSELVVATDSELILKHVLEQGGKAILTLQNHDTGTSRCAEVQKAKTNFDAYINIQGDEPFISPHQIAAVASLLTNGAEIATLAKKDNQLEHLQLSSVIKVVINHKSEALYFSRALIPFVRDAKPNVNYEYLRHIGIYGFRAGVLQAISKLPPSIIELQESLEQLRWLYNGYNIIVGLTTEDSYSIDTPQDLEKVISHFAKELYQ